MSDGPNRGVRRRFIHVMAFGAVFLLAGNTLRGQGTYAPVTAADVVAMRLMQHFDADGKAREPAFHWTFAKDGSFVVKKGAEAIPDKLLKTLLKPAAGRPAAADEVRGNWAVDGGQLVLTDIRAGEAAGAAKVHLDVYRSAPTVIRVDDRQEGPDGKRAKVQYTFVVGG